ncbi:MAG TPA: hypothetical protein VGX23_14250 [Actinocrinis sp.]|nr:hypothetical protein [Actinocrinis sp.]
MILAPANTTTDKRAAFVAGLRAFADLLESDHSIPSPVRADLWAFIQEYDTGLDQDQRFVLVHDFADAHGVQVTEDDKANRAAEKKFGPVLLRVHAYADKKPDAHIVARPVARPATAACPRQAEPETGDLIPA